MSHDQTPPKPRKKAIHDNPEWDVDVKYTRERIAFDEPDLAIAHAKFSEAFPYKTRVDKNGKAIDPEVDEGAHLYWLSQAVWFKDIQRLPDWMDHIQSYPPASLSKDQLEQADNPSVKVRAHFLAGALTSLLKVIGAPSVMIEDVQSIFDLKKPRSADVRGEAQKALINNPDAGVRDIARAVPKNSVTGKARDPGQISKDLTSGKLVRPRKPPL